MRSGRSGVKRIVLDTNVLVSATFWRGDSFFVVKMIDEDPSLHLLISFHILEEYLRVVESEEIMDKRWRGKLHLGNPAHVQAVRRTTCSRGNERFLQVQRL